ncbi:MAG: hypothetical protein FK734_20190 [Asgard group archaeon]|nr:hypothetical protein [Asgard group archaeon]
MGSCKMSGENSSKTVDKLIEKLHNTTDVDARLRIIEELGLVNEDEIDRVIPVLIGLLDDENWLIRANAAELLGNFKDKSIDALPSLKKASTEMRNKSKKGYFLQAIAQIKDATTDTPIDEPVKETSSSPDIVKAIEEIDTVKLEEQYSPKDVSELTPTSWTKKSKHLLKMVVLGDTDVGKTNLIDQIECEEFNTTSSYSFGVAISIKNLEIENKNVVLQILEISSTDRFKPLHTTFVRGAELAFIVFDITYSDSLASVENYVEVLRNSGMNTIITVIGTKSDLTSKRQVSIQEAKATINNLKSYLKKFENYEEPSPRILDYYEITQDSIDVINEAIISMVKESLQKWN